MSNKKLDDSENYSEPASPRERILWLVEYCKQERIRDIRFDKDFLKVCGIKNSSFISDLKSGKIVNPSHDVIRSIEKNIGISEDWISEGEGDPFDVRLREPSTQYNIFQQANVHIPFYKQVKPAAGGGRIIVPDDESDKVLVSLPRAYVTHKLHANPSDIIILEIWNDSMEPIIKNGDIVFISRNVRPPYEGHIYIVQMGESLLCKYIQELPGDKLRVFSENQRYKDFEIQLGEESQESFEIYGRIVGHLHSRL